VANRKTCLWCLGLTPIEAWLPIHRALCPEHKRLRNRMQRERANEQTFWNGEPTPARKVTGVVLDAPEFPQYWARPLVGTRRNAVEVTYNGETFYLDDDERTSEALPPEYAKALGVESEPRVVAAGSGWAKVTVGRGSPSYGHSELRLEGVTARAAGGEDTPNG
jgi:hypothetical protein